MLQHLLDEGNIVSNGSPRENVEGPLRLDYGITHPAKRVVDEVALFLVLGNGNTDALQMAQQVLHQCRGIDEAQCSGAEGQAVEQVFMVGALGVYRYVADSLTGQCQVL